jgi:hypothetical protein
MLRIILLASLLVPGAAHAEFMVRKASDVRAPGIKLPAEPLTVEYILDKVQRTYMPRLRRCYNKGLANDPTLAGTATLTFTVNPYGRVDGTATGIARRVDACLTAALATWRFRTTTARKPATFRLSLQLQQ